ncbi:MAG: hypothetical protein JSR13_05985 [Proteobacteria bacterium]|nr:hypothetical protein [Pseudomonadota bacterium]
MTDTTISPETGPVDAAPMSFDEGVNAIAGLLDDAPEKDPVKAQVATTSEVKPETTEPVQDVEDEAELVLDDADLDDVAEVAADAPPATIGDDFEITLDDGQKISLGELKRNNLFQRDYTRKTTELSELKKQQDEEFSKRVSEAENEIRQQRDFILNYAQRFMPKPPNPSMMDENSPDYDPIGFLHEQRRYEQEASEFNNLVQQREREFAEQQYKQTEEMKQNLAAEQEKLFKAMPKLKDDKAREAFHKEAVDIGGTTYGITPEEISQIGDHRYMRILHDAIQYRKAVAKAAAVQKEVAAKPKLVQQQRMAPQAIQERDRQGRFKNLRETGSIDAAAKAIEAFLT